MKPVSYDGGDVTESDSTVLTWQAVRIGCSNDLDNADINIKSSTLCAAAPNDRGFKDDRHNAGVHL